MTVITTNGILKSIFWIQVLSALFSLVFFQNGGLALISFFIGTICFFVIAFIFNREEMTETLGVYIKIIYIPFIILFCFWAVTPFDCLGSGITRGGYSIPQCNTNLESLLNRKEHSELYILILALTLVYLRSLYDKYIKK